MPESGDVRFGRVKISLAGSEVWIDWDDHAGAKSPLPFTLWRIPGPGEGASIECRIVTKPDIVGWRRAPDPAEGPESDSEGAEAAGPGPEGPT